MNTTWTFDHQEYQLFRYPKNQHDPSLQAWDSADEYLCEHVLSLTPNPHSLLVLNDQFGAITVGLNQLAPTIITDSFVSECAIAQNCELNQIVAPTIFNSLTPLSDAQRETQTVAIRLTKNLGFLEYQLWQVSQLKGPVQVIAAGKTTLVTSNAIKLFEKYLADVHTSLAKKKSRLIFATHPGTNTNNTKPCPFPVTTHWAENELVLTAHANVFSKEQIDIGGRFLAENLPSFSETQRIFDLGCGNGLLGLSVLKATEKSASNIALTFCDESYMAVESAKYNVQSQFPHRLDHCQFTQDDCLSKQVSGSADIILCNPPFHQQNTITEHIANQMFADAKRVLDKDGRLYVVANRHLPYNQTLKKLFGGFKVHHQNKKFIIYSCQKREK